MTTPPKSPDSPLRICQRQVKGAGCLNDDVSQGPTFPPISTS